LVEKVLNLRVEALIEFRRKWWNISITLYFLTKKIVS
jgi:hypothetical protein